MHRLSNSGDFESVYSIYMHEDVVPFLGFDPMPKLEFRSVFASLVSSNSFFVVEVASVVKGFYRVTRHEGRARHGAYLGTLAITPEEKGSGLALRMMSEAIERLQQEGILRVELMLEADNPRALAFYKKLGFVHEGTLRAAYKRSNELHYVDEMLLAKLLTPLPVAGDVNRPGF